MIELLLGITPAPIEQQTLNLLTEKKPAIVQQVKPELTVEEKIKTNYYKCNEAVEYIRADNATCLPKQVVTQVVAKTQTEPIRSNSGSTSGHYTPGQCTAWVAAHRYVPNGWGNASDWKYHAQAEGWTVSSTPVAGAIAWRYGHVAYVVGVGDGEVTVSEQNYDYNSGIRTITIPVDNYLYLYN